MRYVCTRALREKRGKAAARAQVAYALVFFLEYLGPFMIYPIFWATSFRSRVYGIDPAQHPRHVTQDLACFYWCTHYAKARKPAPLLYAH